MTLTVQNHQNPTSIIKIQRLSAFINVYHVFINLAFFGYIYIRCLHMFTDIPLHQTYHHFYHVFNLANFLAISIPGYTDIPIQTIENTIDGHVTNVTR